MKELVLVSIVNPVIVLLYWLSCILIGWAIYQFITKKIKLSRNISGITDNIFLKPTIWFGLFVAVVALYSSILYIFRLPAIFFTGFYVISLIISMIVLIYNLWDRRNRTYNIKLGGMRSWIEISIILLVILILVFDYVVSTSFGTMFAGGADTYVHLAKIMGILHYGFTIDDSILNGVVESRYHVNAIHSLYIPIVQSGHLSPAAAWDLSNAFFRSVQWLSITGLAYFVSRSWLRFNKLRGLLFSAGVLVVVWAMPPLYMFVAVYPTEVVSLWITLFVIGISLTISRFREGKFLTFVSAILITFTQPTYALMVILFLLIYILITEGASVFRTSSINFRTLWRTIGLVILLSVGPLITELFPQRLSGEALSIGAVPTIHILGVSVVSPLWSPTKTPAEILVIAFVGYVYLIVELIKQNRRLMAVFTVLLLSFFYLIACNPFFMAIAHNKLPLWLVGRFTAMNVLQTISFPLGVYAVCYIFYKHAPLKNLYKRIAISIIFVLCSIVVLPKVPGAYRDFYQNTIAIDNGNDVKLERTREELSGVMEPGALAITTLSEGYHLPSAIPVKVLAIDATHATPTADSKDREACVERLFASNLDGEDLDIVGAKYVVIPRWYENLEQVKAALAKTSKLSLLKESTDYIVYTVRHEKPRLDNGVHSNPCYIFQITENGRLY